MSHCFASDSLRTTGRSVSVRHAVGLVKRAIAALAYEKLDKRRSTGIPANSRRNRPDDRKEIERIAPGDIVWAWEELSQLRVERPVVRIFRHRDKPVVSVRMRSVDGSAFDVDASLEHPFWVLDKGWTAACDLQPKDELLSRSGVPVRVLDVSTTGGCEDVFNFEVGGAHNYFVGQIGVLVHNRSAVTTIEEAAYEFEKVPSTFAHIVRKYFDIDAWRKQLPRDIRLYLPQFRDAKVDLSRVMSKRGAQWSSDWRHNATSIPFESYTDLMVSHAVIQSHEKNVESGLVFKPSVPARIREIWSRHFPHRDQDTLEVNLRKEHRILGFDNLMPALKDCFSIYSRQSGITPRSVAQNIQLNLSVAQVDDMGQVTGVNLEPMARAAQVRIVLELLLHPDGERYLRQGISGYNNVRERAIVRMPGYAVGNLSWVETRKMHSINFDANVRRIVSWHRKPPLAYAAMGEGLVQFSGGVERIFDSSRREVLEEDVSYLLGVPGARHPLLKGLGGLRDSQRALASDLLHVGQRTAYSFAQDPGASPGSSEPSIEDLLADLNPYALKQRNLAEFLDESLRVPAWPPGQ